MLQFAVSFINLAVPSTAARIALSVRYFQRLGIARVQALVVGGIDSAAGFVVQLLLLVGILVSGATTLQLGRADVGQIDLGGAVMPVIITLAVLVVGGGVGVLVLPRTRAWIARQARAAASGLQVPRSPRKLTQLIGGNLASQLLFTAALGLSVRAVGSDVSFVDLVTINVAVSLFAGLMPVPGGIGVTEAGLTAGLAAAGLPEEQAFAAAILSRLTTYYLPPIWGFLSLRWLQHHEYL